MADDFKVIVQTKGVDDDENVYHAIVFINPKTVETKELKYDESDNMKKAKFSFPKSIIPAGDYFAVSLIAVDGGTRVVDIGGKIGQNSPKPEPEVIEFP
jgi:hypothetical protein